MSNNSIQHIRGTLAEHSTYTGRKGEISLITDSTNDRVPTGEIRIHDGATAGGVPIKLGTSSSPLTSDIYLASGSGINFSAYGSEDSNSATTVGNNLLDDYEEGTWTPTSTAGVTLNSSIANYQKIGNTVFINAFIDVASNTNTNSLIISVPFALTTGSASVGAFNSKGVDLYAYMDSNGVYIRTSSNVSQTCQDLSGKFIAFQMSYKA